MDFGFGAVLEYFEKYFGKRVTFAILVVLGLAIVAVGISLIWTWLIDPVLKFLDTPLWGQSLASIFWRIGGIIMGVTLGMTWAHDLVRYRRTRELKWLIRSARKQNKAMLDRSTALADKAMTTTSEAQELTNNAFAMLEATVLAAKAQLETEVSGDDVDRATRLARLNEALALIEAHKKDKANHGTSSASNVPGT